MTRVSLFLSDSPSCYQQLRGRRDVVAFTTRRTSAHQNGWLLFHRDRVCAEEQPVQPSVSLGVDYLPTELSEKDAQGFCYITNLDSTGLECSLIFCISNNFLGDAVYC